MQEISFEKYTLSKRISTMLRVDLRRMFSSLTVYIFIASCLLAPILILVMTTMMDGTVSVNPQTGVETVIEGFDNVWQIIGSVSGASAVPDMAGGMSLTAMCNINMLYMALAAFVCLFVSDDFRSGYAKNLFAVRADKTDYILSKTLTTFIASALMVLAFFLGSLLGGAISGLPFIMEGFGISELVFCVLAKMLSTLIVVPIYLTMAVVAKSRAWLSILLSLASGMLLFMMLPMLSPLNSTIINPLLCLGIGVLLSIGLGAISRTVLNKTALV